MIKTAYHPSGLSIKFSSENHFYVDENRKTYTSGTTFISQFFNKFDCVAVAGKCVNGTNPKYAGRNSEDILDEWQAEGDRGRGEGTNIHEYAESLFTLEPSPAPLSERCRAIFKQVDRVVIELKTFYQFVGAEVIVFDPETLLSGTIDLLMYHPGQNEILIFDWKQNKVISTSNGFQRGLKPIDHLEDTDLNHYSLQLSFYERLLRKGDYFPGVTKFNRALIHLTEERFEIIRLEDFNYEIGEMVKTHGKKETAL